LVVALVPSDAWAFNAPSSVWLQSLQANRNRAASSGKPMEVIMKEILAVLTIVCEQDNIDKHEFIEAFYEWYKEKRGFLCAV
jgi:hypothetical protein